MDETIRTQAERARADKAEAEVEFQRDRVHRRDEIIALIEREREDLAGELARLHTAAQQKGLEG